MRPLLPPDGGPIAVTAGTFTQRGDYTPDVLVMIEIDGGPVITLTPHQWRSLVDRIRRAPSARELGA